MRYYFTIIVMIFIMLWQYRKKRSIWAATVIYPIMWILSLIGLAISDLYYEVSWSILNIIMIGYILFCIGFNIADKGCEECTIYNAEYKDRLNGVGLNIIYYISLIIGLVYLILVRNYVSISDIALSMTTLIGNKTSKIIQIPAYMTYIDGAVSTTLKIYLLMYFRSKQDEKLKTYFMNKKMGLRCVVLLVISVLIVLTHFSRNALLSLTLPIFFIFFISKKVDGKKVILWGGLLFILFVVLFIWYSYFRDAFLYENEKFWTVTVNRFSLYLSGGIVALNQAKEKYLSWFSLDGLNHTFAFAVALIDKMFGTNHTPDVVLDSISIGNNVRTNVYTVYYWNALDLGVIYSVCCQFILGWIYGYFYKRVRLGSFRALYWYSTLSFSLVFMFFADQYASIGQSWVIRIITYIIIATICGLSRIKIGKLNQGRAT